MTDCLVYFFTGFLDSGKTSTIVDWLNDPSFEDKKIIILATEDGEKSFDDFEYDNKPIIIYKEVEEITKEFMFALEKEHKPDVIFMEWNGSVSPSEFFDKVDVPRRLMLAAAVAIVDASSYSAYYANMQTIFADYYRFCDTVVFNRVDPESNNLPKLRASVKTLNPGASIVFLDNEGEPIDIGLYLPYDLSMNPCEIAPDDFGLFYSDAIDNVERYNDKVVSIVGEAQIFREFRGKAFALTRKAYTCCSDDIGRIAVLCFKEYGSSFPAGEYLKVTGTIHFYKDKQNDREVAMPYLEVIDYAITSKPDNEIIYFS